MRKAVSPDAQPAREQLSVPEDLLRALLTNAKARTEFEALAPSHRRKYVRWIGEAKKEETRRNRIAKTLQMVLKKA